MKETSKEIQAADDDGTSAASPTDGGLSDDELYEDASVPSVGSTKEPAGREETKVVSAIVEVASGGKRAPPSPAGGSPPPSAPWDGRGRGPDCRRDGPRRGWGLGRASRPRAGRCRDREPLRRARLTSGRRGSIGVLLSWVFRGRPASADQPVRGAMEEELVDAEKDGRHRPPASAYGTGVPEFSEVEAREDLERRKTTNPGDVAGAERDSAGLPAVAPESLVGEGRSKGPEAGDVRTRVPYCVSSRKGDAVSISRGSREGGGRRRQRPPRQVDQADSRRQGRDKRARGEETRLPSRIGPDAVGGSLNNHLKSRMKDF